MPEVRYTKGKSGKVVKVVMKPVLTNGKKASGKVYKSKRVAKKQLGCH